MIHSVSVYKKIFSNAHRKKNYGKKKGGGYYSLNLYEVKKSIYHIIMCIYMSYNIKNYLRPPYSHNYLGTTIHAPSTEASLGVQIVSSLCFTKLSLVPKNNLQISH